MKNKVKKGSITNHKKEIRRKKLLKNIKGFSISQLNRRSAQISERVARKQNLAHLKALKRKDNKK